jgi:hypothetical protein
MKNFNEIHGHGRKAQSISDGHYRQIVKGCLPWRCAGDAIGRKLIKSYFVKRFKDRLLPNMGLQV